ncbi:hypothetical protein HAX54_028933 [Datura stramonium]|uniref:Uncharacterized protein n=1 Tax=Datura stramonium TaxID=4076 RepID=A0ABS8V5F6_DATST|nr:hypothetical protein [Datura stramonium]
MPRSSEYAFTPANFARVVRKADRQDKQLKLFAEQLGSFVDRAIIATLEPYKNLDACMDDMEVRERQPPEFLIDKFEESEDDAHLIDLLGKVEEEMRIEEMRARVGGASSSLEPQATMPDPLSVTTATKALANGFEVITPYTVTPESRV